MLNFLLLSFMMFAFSSFSQNCFDEIRDLPFELPPAYDLNEQFMLEIQNKFNCFIGEELDSIDIQLMATGPMLGTLLVKYASEHEDNSEITYGAVYNFMVKTKKEQNEYTNLRDIYITAERIKLLPALESSWGEVSSFLSQIELSSDEIETFYNYFHENLSSEKTVQDILMGYQDFKTEQYENRRNSTETVEQFERLFANYGAIDIEFLIKESLSTKKPILLYFTGYNCVNCRRIEQTAMNNSQVLNELEENFVFIALYVDDKSTLPESQSIFLKDKLHIAETVGDVNILIQISEFEIVAQPYFVALEADGKVLGSTDYEKSNDIQSFLRFLNGITKQTNE